ncbi:LacI family DNA-binding transcriptional regulator [Nocardioides eburneiflavus]|uniref:LacI family DNA-binding transcriptional regulator n=1 Tax=Nocardioides eburneiflavus TaxID=2518372 RepID=UPI001FE4FF01|nr:LacI family DNA-binding transcriptional regulator [Nocardioides eburneiflavus]
MAALAGVSMKTVSRVVNGEPGVAPAKVESVERAVRQLDYRPNLTASSLRRLDGRTAAVAALLEDLANPFSAELHRALEDVAHEHDVLLFAGSLDESPEREKRLVRAFTSRRADALILAPATSDQGYLTYEVPEGTPIVFVDRAPSGYEADAVVADNVDGARRAVTHLIGHGHRRIAFLGDRTAIQTARDRFAGYQQALHARGVPFDPDLVVHGLEDAGRAAAALPRLMELRDPPSALFAAQNEITVGAIRHLQAAELQDRVAIVGFDDFPLADLLRPGVTVVAQDPTAIGRAAAERVFARLAGDSTPARTVVIPTRLVVRGSGEIPAPAGPRRP